MKPYPTSKTQDIVLKALGLTAADFGEAEQIFKRVGLVVTSRRQGRSTMPVIQVLDRKGGAFNAHGEGVEFDQYPAIDTSTIEQWIE